MFDKSKLSKNERLLFWISETPLHPPKSQLSRNFIRSKIAAGNRIPFEIRFAISLLERGVNPQQLRQSISESANILNQTEKKQLEDAADIMSSLNKSMPDFVEELREENPNPQNIKVTKMSEGESSHGAGNLIVEETKEGLKLDDSENRQEYYSEEFSKTSAKTVIDRVNSAVAKDKNILSDRILSQVQPSQLRSQKSIKPKIDRIVIRISSDILQPPSSKRVKHFASAIDATTGLGAKSKVDKKILNPGYFEEAEKFVEDNVSSYADNLESITPDYTEPDYSIPNIGDTSHKATPSSEPSYDRSPIQKGVDSLTNNIKSAARKAVNVAKNAAQKAVKQGLQKLAVAAAPILAKMAIIAAAAAALAAAFFAWLVTTIITIVLWTIGFIAFVAIILFIINSGAYMVPPGEDLTIYGPGGIGDLSDYQCTDVEHPECPCGWPVFPYENEGVLDVYQGSYTLESCSGTHNIIEAIDIIHAESGELPEGHPVTSRVTGTVTGVWYDDTYGNAVQIESECFGQIVRLRYGHNTSVGVAEGQSVEMGQTIAFSGNTGMGGAHVHYEFANPDPFSMTFPNIPKNVPKSCNTYGHCPFDCNVQIP